LTLLAGVPALATGLGGLTPVQGADARPGLKIPAKSKLVMIGDSITDTGRARPVGEGRGEAIGKGYVMMVEALLGTVYPEQWIRIINMGISGNTVRDLKARWQTDVTDLQPDWVSIMIGANDVWRQFDSPRQTERHVPVEEYEKTLDELVETTQKTAKGMILITPFYLEPNKADAMRAAMDRYGAAVKRVALARKTVFVDSQAAFDDVLKTYYPASIMWDRVHLDHVGSMVLARAIVNALGFSWTR
jgi:lysophospholipase L1-like esterase